MSLIPKKGNVYVVDDDEAVRDSLQWLLEGKDYRVRCFDSAETFLSRYDPREVACLLVDIRMPGISGLELQDRLIERKSPLPIVFITGHGDVPMAVTTMKKGAMDFIQKPFKEDQLVALVERMLGCGKNYQAPPYHFGDDSTKALNVAGIIDATHSEEGLAPGGLEEVKPETSNNAVI
jgi:FixJ family two-component response regulator